MGRALAQAVAVRANAARWLFQERLPEWDFGIVVVSEPHSALEGLWHGIDESHPLHRVASADAARQGLVSVYRAVDCLIGELTEAFPDTAIVVFSMGGMGPNRSDVASMVLLPELLYRHAFGRPRLRQPEAWSAVSDIGPQLNEHEGWGEAVNVNLLPTAPYQTARRVAARLIPELVKNALRPCAEQSTCTENDLFRPSIDWMPAARYQPDWHRMGAFALPSFYDGRIRINLAGRERDGMVCASQYEHACDEIEAILRQCRNAATGEDVIADIERVKGRKPLTLGSTESDLVVVWKGMACAFDHPKLGRLGPIPFRRPGGHTGEYGMAYIYNGGISAGDRGVRSSFDVVPTLIDLLGEPVPRELSGTSLLAAPQ
jgi:predicted AlkP superfamily phosphohydrolase/phosphomutase